MSARQLYVHGRVRTREVPGEKSLLVYQEDRCRISILNAKLWLLFALCNGKTYEEIAPTFRAAIDLGRDLEQATAELRQGLAALEDAGLVRRPGDTLAPQPYPNERNTE
ncbi:hypothetical protein ACIGBL_33620 [Streptomyces sp. NPDC085614]|uniref:hypothetical protein n=1 Tax=Streptomyces sp. NPDC085614 TaxID=3365733 RepID=UPI0037D8F7AE